MKFLTLLTLTLLVSCAGNNSEWTPLFNGEDLSGWNGDEKWFRVEEGVIIAGHLDVEKIPHNYFLASNEFYHDFELKLKVKTKVKSPKHKTNGGIQIRSNRQADTTHVIGYQCDLGDKYWGAIYDEHRRRKFLTPMLSADALKVVNQSDWNDYHIVCKGNTIKVFINGQKTADYTEEDAKLAAVKGFIALQVHSARHPMEIHYKDIFLKRL